MEKKLIKVEIKVDADKAILAIEKATIAAQELRKALSDLKNAEIDGDIASIKKSWWQFWNRKE